MGTGYWGYQAVCGGAICEMEPGLALSLTIEPYRSWWVQANCQVVQCQFNSRRLTKPHLVKPLCENDDSLATVAFLGQKQRGQPLCVRPSAFFRSKHQRQPLSMYGCPRCIPCHWRCTVTRQKQC